MEGARPSVPKSTAPRWRRYSWKGFLRLSLVSVPVQAFNAVQSDEGKIQLHQLHEKDHARIRYVKVCPQHGEIPASEIVKGYEVSKDEYVVIEPDELDALSTRRLKRRSRSTRSSPRIDRSGVLRRAELLPDARRRRGREAVCGVRDAMVKQDKWGVGQAVMFGREHLVLVRPHEGLLSLATIELCPSGAQR